MPPVDLYHKTLPDWTALRALEESETEAAVELLVALTQIGELDADAAGYEEIRSAWVDLFCTPDWVTRAAFLAHIDTCQARIRNLLEHPGAVATLLASACTRLRAPGTQAHILDLSIATTFFNASNPRQMDLIYRVAKRFDHSQTRVDERITRLRAASQQLPQSHRGRDNEKAKLSAGSWDTHRR